MNAANMNLDMLKVFGTNGYEAARALAELNLRTWEKLAEKQLETFGLLVDTANAQIKLATEAKDINDIQDVVTSQTELSKKLAEELTTKGRETLEVANDTRDEYKSWLESGIAKATEVAQKAA